MKKLLLGLTAAVFFIIYALSCSESFMKFIAQARYQSDAFWGSDKYAYGDLFGLSYLPQFRIQQPPTGYITVDVPKGNRDINLYGLVDSHIYAFVKSDTIFYGVKNYWYSKWADSAVNETIHIDTTKKNVLFIEVVEHNIRLFADTNHVFKKFKVSAAPAPAHQYANKAGKTGFSGSLLRGLRDGIFDKAITQNLEFNLFNYRLFTPLKELKANINYKLFNRVDKDVIVSGNGKYLYLTATADTNYESSFYPIPQPKVDKIVHALNVVYNHYKSIGFDEVYFTMVPNPVSILEPNMGNYNNLIPRIQNNPALQMKTVDLFDLYKTTNLQVYKNSDTHYTNDGFKLWVEEFNKKLMEVRKKD